MQVTDLGGAGLLVPYERMAPGTVAEIKGRIADAAIALIGGALSVSVEELDALRAVAAGLPAARPAWPTDFETSLEMAGFLNAYFIRYADWGDTYRHKNTIGGHSSDQLAAIFALCGSLNIAGRRIIEATHLAYQMYATLQTRMFAAKPYLDYTSALSLTTPVLAAVCNGDPPERIQNALNVSACNGIIIHQVRPFESDTTNLKSAASAIAVARGLQSYRLSEVIKAPASMFDGEYGWYEVVAPLDGGLAAMDPEATYSPSEVKTFPCFQVGQAPVECAVKLHALLKDRLGGIGGMGGMGGIEKITLSVTEADKKYVFRHGQTRYPSDQPDADHNVRYCVAVALLFGGLTPVHYRPELLVDERIRRLIDLIEMRIMAEDEAKRLGARKGACILEVKLSNGPALREFLPQAGGNLAGLDAAGRVSRLQKVFEQKCAMLEEFAGLDLSPLAGVIGDLEEYDGRALLSAIGKAIDR